MSSRSKDSSSGIGPLLEELEDAVHTHAEWSALTPRLKRLHAQLAESLRDRQRSWLYRQFPETCPRHAEHLARLEREGRRLLARAEQLVNAGESGTSVLPASVNTLLLELHLHHTDEQELLIAALYDDLGCVD